MIWKLLMMPMPAVYLLLISLILKTGRWKRRLMITAMCLLILGGMPVAGKLLLYPLMVHKPGEDVMAMSVADLTNRFDVLLVPTAGSRFAYGDTAIPTVNTYWRIGLAHALHEKTDMPVILSGGDLINAGLSEAELAGQQGHFKLTDAILDTNSRNTAESARAFSDLMAEHGFSKPLVITDDKHMSRMLASLRGRYIIASGTSPAFDRLTPVQWQDFVPQRAGYNMINRAVNTYTGLFFYIFQGYNSINDLWDTLLSDSWSHPPN